MGRRIFGGVLFLWMAASGVGLFKEGGIREHAGTRLIVDLFIMVVVAALAALGLVMLLGKSKKPTDGSPPADQN